MKKFYLFFAILAMYQMVFSQQQEICGTDAVMLEFYKNNPAAKLEADAFNSKLTALAKSNQLKKFETSKSSKIYEIPIVVHVISDGSALGTDNNKSDQQIRNWIDYTNRVFAATADKMVGDNNGGTVIPIKFVLAKRTPTGGMSNGINRVNASGNTKYVQNGVNSTSGYSGITEDEVLQIAPNWNSSKYYNIYVVKNLYNKDSKVNGYAYYPSSNSWNKYFSFMDTSVSVVNAQTLAHEFGHGMNLMHTHGQGAGADCNGDDLVSDTEVMKSLYDSSIPKSCQTGSVNPCTGVKYAGGEQNVMAYTYCFRNRFTPGQRDRAMNSFLAMKASLTTSDAKYPPTIYAKNGGGNSIGTSWANAGNLADVLNNLNNIKNDGYWDEDYPLTLWVAKGYHIPKYQYGGGNTRDRTFLLVKNVQLYGGFNGDETKIDFRKTGQNETVLNGEKTVAHVVVSAGAVGSALLDGFTIWNGNADYGVGMDLNGEGINHRYGGGMYIDNSSPIVRNSVFKDNYSKERGGGVYIENKAKPVFQNVVFMQNTAGSNGDGGAIYVNDDNTKLSLYNCSITKNSASDGGAIRFDDDAEVVFYNSIFYNNTSNNNPNTLNAEMSFNGNKTSFNAFVNKNSGYIKNNIFQYFDKGINNIRSNPNFVTNDFKLSSNSPAINKGDNNLYIELAGSVDNWKDVLGQNRVINSRIDIGAWEMQCSTASPVASNSQFSFCGSATVADLISRINSGSLEVYESTTAYQKLGTDVGLKNNTTYYIFKSDANGCQSARVPVKVIINSIPAKPVSASAKTIFCQGINNYFSNITVSGASNPKWYATSTGGTALNPDTFEIQNQVFYYVSEQKDGCESSRVSFRFIVNPRAQKPTGNLDQKFEKGAKVSQLGMNQAGIKWYSTQTDAENNTNVLDNDDNLVTQKYYAVATSAQGCHSLPTEVSVTVDDGTLGTLDNTSEGVKIYPNPFSDAIKIVGNKDITKISLYDTSGKLVLDSVYQSKEVNVDTQKLTSGNYIIKVTMGENTLTQKIIKK